MIRTAIFAAALLCALSSVSHARPSHHKHGVNHHHSQAYRAARGKFLEQRLPIGRAIVKPISQSDFDSSGQVASHARFIAGRLVCALNIGMELARRGIQGTGSALARSYLGWGRSSGPVPGAVAVFSRGRHGGHVAIVHHIEPNGTIYYLNPSSRRQAWHIGPYNRAPMAFRVPS